MGLFSKIGSLGLGASGSALLGGLGGGGGDPAKKQYKNILAQHALLQRQNQASYANALYQQKQGLNAINKGYGAALQTLGTQGNAAKRSIVDRETANTGALKAGLVSSGLSDTTTAANLQRGIYSDTNRDLAGVDEAIAQIKANLQAQQAGAQAGQYGAMAGLFQGQAASNAGLGQSLINTIGNVQYSDPNAWLNQLLGIGGTIGGFALGGPPGAAAGNAIAGSGGIF